MRLTHPRQAATAASAPEFEFWANKKSTSEHTPIQSDNDKLISTVEGVFSSRLINGVCVLRAFRGRVIGSGGHSQRRPTETRNIENM